MIINHLVVDYQPNPMRIPDGYIRISVTEVKRRCKLVINLIKKERKKEDDQTISKYLKRHKRWSFLPWWKPMSEKKP